MDRKVLTMQIGQAAMVSIGGMLLLSCWADAQEDGGAPPKAEAAASVSAASPVEHPKLLAEGLRACSEGLPQIAAYKLRAFLQTSPPAAQRREAVMALARALLSTNDPTGALNSLRAENLPEADGQMRYWRARAQAALTHWDEALNDYQAATEEPATSAEARFGAAEALLALGQANKAADAFKALAAHAKLGVAAQLRLAFIALDGGRLKEAANLLEGPGRSAPDSPRDSQQRAELLGRLRLLQNQPASAEQIFVNALAHPEGMSEQVMVNHYEGWAQACLAQREPAKAEDALEGFLDHIPDGSAYLPKMLAWLEQLYIADPAPDDLADLRRWSSDDKAPNRQTLATLALSRGELRSGRVERAEEILLQFSRKFPDSPLCSRAWLELAALRLSVGRTGDAQQALAQARTLAAGATEQNLEHEIDALDARLSLAEGSNSEAAKKFQTVAARIGDGPQAEAAAFNAVLGWMRAPDATQSAAAESRFAEQFPTSRLQGEFPLEEGLAEAARSTVEDSTSRQRATASLRRFLRDSPLHPRAAEARIALAELAFMRPRPNLAAAWRELSPIGYQPIQNTAVGPPNADPGNDRAEYLAIWLSDAPNPERDEDRAVALAKQFLERRPESPLAAEVRMKLCEIYFRKGDYSDAQTQLELLVEKMPSSPLAESASYLAGLAAARSMNPAGLVKAVKLFEDTAKRNGPFKLSARLRQAEVQNQLKRAKDALTLYEDVLSATMDANLSDAGLEARCEALGSKGQTLIDLAASDKKLYADAAQTFEQLANTPGASLPWRRQALTKKGLALEKMGDSAAALSTYFEALNAEPATSESPEPEWTWFYRAGLNAASLLEAQSDWAGAVAIYQKLAAADGILKNQFETLKKNRQLEHFIADE